MWPKEDKVLMQLSQLEAQIVQMLGYLSEPSSSSILKRRLRQAEEYVMEIPDDQIELARTWREKLADWWAVFASKGYSATADEPAELHPPNVTITGGGDGEGGELYFGEEGPDPGNPDAEFDDEFKQSKDGICEQMAQLFGPAVPVITSVEDIESAKALVQLVAKAETLAFAYLRDFPFQKKLLEYIMPKLPSEWRVKFLGQRTTNPHEPKTVISLKLFLIKEIKAQQVELRAKMLEQNPFPFAIVDDNATAGGVPQPSSSQPNDESVVFAVDANVTCANCKVEGHMVADCPETKKLRCFNCFERGHLSTRCPQL